MNAPSPFTPAGEAHFTVKELASLLPGNMVRADALPPDHPVEFPPDVLKASISQGRSLVRLSSVYAACPFLFTRQVLPQEDIDIVLPVGKVNRILEASGNAEASPAAVESPFARAASAFATQAASQASVPEPVLPPMRANSPFGIANGNGNGAASPFAVKSPGGVPGGPPNPGEGTPSPFAAVVGKPLDNPFAAMPSGNAGAAPVFEGNTPPVSSPFARAASAPGPDSNPFAAVKPPTSPVSPSPFAAIAAAAAAAPKVATSPFSLAGMLPPKPATPAPAEPPAMAPAVNGPSPVPVQEMRSEHQTNMPPLPAQAAHAVPLPPLPAAPAPAAPTPVSPKAAAPETQESAVQNVAPPKPAAQPGSGENLSFTLRPLLGSYKQEELGFDPLAVPETVEVTVPAALITSQLSSGKVSLDLDQLRGGLAERFHPAFARTQPNLQFQIPLAEVFRVLPQHLIPAPALPAPDHTPILTSPFQTPFTLKAEEDQAGIPLPPELAPGKQITSSTPVSAAASPFGLPPAAPTVAASPAAAAVIPPPAPFPAAPVAPPETPVSARPNPFSRPPGAGTAPTNGISIPPGAPASVPPTSMGDSDDLGQAIHAEALRSTPPSHSLSPAQVPPAPAPAPQPVVPAPAAPRSQAPAPAVKAADDFSFGIVDDVQQLALRALFMTEETLDAGQILAHCAALPGIRAAILMNGTSTRSALDGAGNEEAHTFASAAPQTYSSITTLAESMGMPQQGNFTIRSNKSVRSFFVERGICLAVLHEQAVFQPGVRERLILIARALSSMEGQALA